MNNGERVDVPQSSEHLIEKGLDVLSGEVLW
jgi:hypothetical protein